MPQQFHHFLILPIYEYIYLCSQKHSRENEGFKKNDGKQFHMQQSELSLLPCKNTLGFHFTLPAWLIWVSLLPTAGEAIPVMSTGTVIPHCVGNLLLIDF